MNKEERYHIPVLFEESLEGLSIKPDGIYVDVTFGGGGHAKEIYNRLSDSGKLIAFDQDPDAKKNAWIAQNFHFVDANFSYLKNHLKLLGITQVDGILADLGVSSHQFNKADRGFSIRFDSRLDMRMSQVDLSAWEVVNEYEEEQLANIFYRYGELRNSRKIASVLVMNRAKKTIDTTFELIHILRPLVGKHKENKFFAQVFQALRIEVNKELEVLEEFLLQAEKVLSPNGRLVVISYHSLEDRLVKNFIKKGNIAGVVQKDFYGNVLKPFDEVVRNPLMASEEELAQNPRSRSAKLRIAIKR
jgi:16S rRNA (cytosine1402-N4)-methyltransferase